MMHYNPYHFETVKTLTQIGALHRLRGIRYMKRCITLAGALRRAKMRIIMIYNRVEF